MRIVLALLVVSALTVVFAFSQDSVDAPEAPNEAITNGPIDAAAAPDEDISADSVEPIVPADIEAPKNTAVDAPPAPDSEFGD